MGCNFPVVAHFVHRVVVFRILLCLLHDLAIFCPTSHQAASSLGKVLSEFSHIGLNRLDRLSHKKTMDTTYRHCECNQLFGKQPWQRYLQNGLFPLLHIKFGRLLRSTIKPSKPLHMRMVGSTSICSIGDYFYLFPISWGTCSAPAMTELLFRMFTSQLPQGWYAWKKWRMQPIGLKWRQQAARSDTKMKTDC